MNSQTTGAVAAKGREWLKIEPDKKYGLGFVDARFELPFDFPPSQEMAMIAAGPTVTQTVDQFERLGGWRYVGDEPGLKWEKYRPTLRISAMPTRAQLDTFNLLKKHEVGQALNAQDKPVIVLSVRLWFIRPMDVVNQDMVDEDAKFLNEKEGYVSPEAMPDEYKEALLHEPRPS